MTSDYALTPKTHAQRLARYMNGRWVSQLRAAVELHICEIHPRFPEIERAGGAVKKREFGPPGEKWAEYTLIRGPRVKGFSEEQRASVQIQVPGDNDPSGFVPPPKIG